MSNYDNNNSSHDDNSNTHTHKQLALSRRKILPSSRASMQQTLIETSERCLSREHMIQVYQLLCSILISNPANKSEAKQMRSRDLGSLIRGDATRLLRFATSLGALLGDEAQTMRPSFHFHSTIWRLIEAAIAHSHPMIDGLDSSPA